ncbi:MAG TPA: hypothetical protein VLL52_01800 [Anaerolineae bacterium]|nr:hypothetical protein [Anaerolineae bacterium]
MKEITGLGTALAMVTGAGMFFWLIMYMVWWATMRVGGWLVFRWGGLWWGSYCWTLLGG